MAQKDTQMQIILGHTQTAILIWDKYSTSILPRHESKRINKLQSS